MFNYRNRIFYAPDGSSGAEESNLPEDDMLWELVGDEGETGGSGVFMVTFSGNSELNNAACDKTFEEIYTAFFVDHQQIVAMYCYPGQSGENGAYHMLPNILISDLLFSADYCTIGAFEGAMIDSASIISCSVTYSGIVTVKFNDI